MAVTAVFLTWKHAGWRTFLEFSTNRSNTAGLSAWARGWNHARLWADLNFDNAAVPVALGLLATASVLLWRNPFWVACVAYFAASVLAFSRHSFFLDRLQVGAGVVLVVLAGLGAVALLDRLASVRPAWASPAGGGLLAAAVAVTLGNGAAAERQMARILPTENVRLAAVSGAVRRSMGEHDSVLVLGTFNAFSRPWATRLWHMSRPGRGDAGLTTELDYPLSPGRSGLDPGWDPTYAEMLERRLADLAVDAVITIEPYAGSVWRDGDYMHWNDWKNNYVRAVGAHPDIHRIAEIDVPEAGVRVGVHRIDTRRVRYVEGFLPLESWGRWCVARRAVLDVPVAAGGTTCVIRTAAWGHQPVLQTCRVLLADSLLAAFVVDTPPWQWRDFDVVIGPRPAGRVALTLEVADLWPAGPGVSRLVALPVQDVFVR